MSGENDRCAAPGGEYPSDCEVTRGLREKAMARQKQGGERGYAWRSCLPRAERIRLLLLDVDGILTDGTITYTHDGGENKSFHTRDGFGITMLQRSGVDVGLITARESAAVSRRAADLSLKYVFQKRRDKLAVFEEILAGQRLAQEQVAYMGDDWLDLPLLTRVGFAATVADAVAEVRERVHYVTRLPGGHGAVREVCDLILAARGMDRRLLEEFLAEK